ncbi:MAG: hypothetical protein ACTSRG_12970 [Candidatus Helarchaeota archaeon]
MDKILIDLLNKKAKEKKIRPNYSNSTLDLLREVYKLAQENYKCPLCKCSKLGKDGNNKIIKRITKRTSDKLIKVFQNKININQGLPDNLFNL